MLMLMRILKLGLRRMGTKMIEVVRAILTMELGRSLQRISLAAKRINVKD